MNELTNEVAPKAPWFEKPEYVLRDDRLAALRHRFEILNRRATKLGVEPVRLTVVSSELRQVFARDAIGELEPVEGVFVKWHTVRVEGPTPKLAGYTFVATLQATEAGNIIRAVPGADNLPELFRTVKPCCDHCRLERRRNETFIVRHDCGSYKQVGRQCIADFLGQGNPALIAATLELTLDANLSAASEDNDGEGSEGGGRQERYYGTDAVAAIAAQAVLQFGWCSKAKAELSNVRSTCSRVFGYLNPPPASRGNRYSNEPKLEKPTDEAKALAIAAREFVIAEYEGKADLSDFQHNLLTVAKLSVVEGNQFGLACYLVQHYRGEQGKRAEAAKWTASHVGTVGVRARKVALTLVWQTSFDTDFGRKTIFKFRNADGCQIVWKSSSGVELANGAEIVADFTVKAHGDYKGTLQTEVSRLKIVEEKACAAV